MNKQNYKTLFLNFCKENNINLELANKIDNLIHVVLDSGITNEEEEELSTCCNAHILYGKCFECKENI